MITIEICANSIASAVHAQNAGAHRIELCESLETGGLTPSAGILSLARERLNIPVHVLIRPRNGDYCYDEACVEVMRRDIAFVQSLGFEGIVIGALQPDGALDTTVLDQLLEVAGNMSVTFHRAFDVADNPFSLTEKLIERGIERILTSGRQPTAMEGYDFIAQMQQNFGNKIKIMAGSGINSGNIISLLRHTGVKECHLSARRVIQGNLVPHTFSKLKNELVRFETDPDEVRKIIYLTSGFIQPVSGRPEPRQGHIFL